MTFSLSFDVDNDAFADDLASEVGAILRRIAGSAESGATSGVIIDSNGNCVGSWDLA